ncbi:DUF3304 domain-containing protein [Massilia sp. UMI-21]|nr:DUF3304 domain-containing protein [Massilia sp. UMI-21]
MNGTNKQEWYWERRVGLLPACLAMIFLLSACEKPTVDVNVHGVNYTKDTFSYVVSDPVKPDTGSGGELVDPFGAGGMTCCVTLPKKWRPGIKLRVRTTYWVEEGPERQIQVFNGEHVVDVPNYLDGKPGELWVLREADGQVSVISSDVQPDHPGWPGKVKGWPIPSLEYRLERWELFRKHQQMYVDTFSQLLDELEKSPDARAKEAWAQEIKYHKESLNSFSGPEDPRYREYLKKDYLKDLEYSRAELAKIMEMKP